jgi:hypothetical protein
MSERLSLSDGRFEGVLEVGWGSLAVDHLRQTGVAGGDGRGDGRNDE